MLIAVRNGPCQCGCRGKDSQHAPVFLRIVRETWAAAEGTTEVSTVSTTPRIVRRYGVVRFPWGREVVGFNEANGWFRLASKQPVKG